ncbi:MAG: DUF4129 domain-containing protein [Candidatus Promineofilum sp.]|nr:DUF4129 domain-containing protein [Promineifilum sp.]
MSRRRTVRNKGVIAAARVQRAPEPGHRLAFRMDPWTRRLIRPLLITLLSTSVAIALLVIVRILSPELSWMEVVPLCFVAALEGAYTTAWLNNPDSHGVDRLTYRVAEVFLLLVIARVYSWILFGDGIPSPDEMRLYLTAPTSMLLVGGFLTTAFTTLVAWGLAVSHSRTLTRLDVSIYEINFYTLSPAEQKAKADDRPIQLARKPLQDQYLSNWLAVGMLMIFMAALSTFEVGQLTSLVNPLDITRLGLAPAMLLALMTYFISGFWLLSHARLLRLNARWLMDGVAKDAGFERAWQRDALFVLLGIALLAAFLPIGSSLAISRILALGLTAVSYLVSIVFSFFGYLIGSALILLTRNANEMPLQPPELAPLPPIDPAVVPPSDPSPLVSMVISSAFWALVIAFIIAAGLFFLRERGYRLDRQRINGYRLVVSAWLHELWDKLRGRARALSNSLQDRLRAPSPLSPGSSDLTIPRPRFLRAQSLSPREQIRFYYLALVRRAAASGVGRRNDETPLEFAQHLKNIWPESEADVDALTQAFLEARYSPQLIEAPQANTIKQLWKTLRTRLRRRS